MIDTNLSSDDKSTMKYIKTAIISKFENLKSSLLECITRTNNILDLDLKNLQENEERLNKCHKRYNNILIKEQDVETLEAFLIKFHEKF